MEPLSTFFRISPALLFQNFTTPRSHASSSFSSPSFADHQTGLKVYCESPASLTSAHQDNPLFEGFPVLPASNRKAEASCSESFAGDEQVTGNSPKLQDQLHHLLTVLQHALEVHGTEGLPDEIAPQLADELEAVAKKLKDKEREVAVERQLRAKVQLALTGAEATIRKLRATPTRGTSASGWGMRWRCNEAAALSPTATTPGPADIWNPGRKSARRTQAAGTTRVGGLRDSVCRQLLQSPSSSMSPLSMTGPSAATSIPIAVVDDASMASPKELPTDQQRSQSCQITVGTTSSCEHVLIPTGIQRMRQISSQSSEAATSSSFHPPLYNWMKAVLSTSTKQAHGRLHSYGSGNEGVGAQRCASTNSSTVQSPAPCGVVGNSIAAAIRFAISKTRTPPLVYGSPLYRRIQRLLAEQRSPSPFRQAVVLVEDAPPHVDSVDQSPTCGGRAGCRMQVAPMPTGSRPVWDQERDTDSASVSDRRSDTTSSSCYTPAITARDDIASLPFRSSVSPFGPTLREKYAARSRNATSDEGSVQRPVVAESAASKTPSMCGGPSLQPAGHAAEAAALVAELGLDLQLDLATADNISNIEVLEHMERWAREQFITKRVLHASKEALLETDGDSDAVGSSKFPIDLSTQALVDTAVQTESVDTRFAVCLQSRVPKPVPFGDGGGGGVGGGGGGNGDGAAAGALGTCQSKHRPTGRGPAGVAHVQCAGVSWDMEGSRDGAIMDDVSADVCALSRNDQSKRSPVLKGKQQTDEAAANNGRPLRDSGTAECSSKLAIWARKRHAAFESVGWKGRRGLFRAIGRRCNPSTDANDGRRVDVDHEDGVPGCHFDHLPRPDITPADSSLSQTGPSCRPDLVRFGHPFSKSTPRPNTAGAVRVTRHGDMAPHVHTLTGQGRLSQRNTPREENTANELPFTPGISAIGGSKGGCHRNRGFPGTSGCGRGHQGDPERVTPLAGRRCTSGVHPLAGVPAGSARNCLPGECGPSTARGLKYPDDTVAFRAEETNGSAAGVPFTPRNTQSAVRRFGDKRSVVPFRLDSAIRFEDEESDVEGDISARTLSSISSVSIIGLDPIDGTNDDAEEDQPDQPSARCLEHKPACRASPRTVKRPGDVKSPLSQYLCGFLASLIPCTHGSDAV
ncbi:hypothetical protein VaNZ11_017202 [Volvox africanus]|uniref:Uncharacterized protein n=1 Tax=Volvox africanus TaxID=51714 RepID=A0ABQ5SQY7_9CHLO|nr:hypothetical protein VaNZ11_017202 [Volvox africanus]